MKGCYEALLVNEVLVMRVQSIGFEQPHKTFIYSGLCCHLKK